jgi:hypothetical protein
VSWDPIQRYGPKQKSWAVRRTLADIDIDFKDVAAMLGATKQEYDLAVPWVINRELVSARAKVTRAVATQLSIKPQSLVRRRLRIDRANRTHHAGSLRFLVRPIPLSRIPGVRQVKVKGGGVTAPGQLGYVGGFLAHGYGKGPLMAFRRKGRARYPLDVIKIDIYRAGEEIMTRVMDEAEDHSKERLARELERRISLRMKAAA